MLRRQKKQSTKTRRVPFCVVVVSCAADAVVRAPIATQTENTARKPDFIGIPV